MRFSLGELDVTGKVFMGIFFVRGDGVSGDKEYGVGTLMRLDGKRDLLPPCAKRKICLLSIFPKLLCRGRIGGFGWRIWPLWTC